MIKEVSTTFHLENMHVFASNVESTEKYEETRNPPSLPVFIGHILSYQILVFKRRIINQALF